MIMSIFQKKIKKILIIKIFSLICLEKNSPLLRNLQKSLQTCKQVVLFLLILKKL